MGRLNSEMGQLPGPGRDLGRGQVNRIGQHQHALSLHMCGEAVGSGGGAQHVVEKKHAAFVPVIEPAVKRCRGHTKCGGRGDDEAEQQEPEHRCGDGKGEMAMQF